LTLSSVPIFDDRFYNISFVRESSTGSLTLAVRLYESDSLVYSGSMKTISAAIPDVMSYDGVRLGAWAGSSSGEFWAQEVRVWDAALVQSELESHARDFMSYGRELSL